MKYKANRKPRNPGPPRPQSLANFCALHSIKLSWKEHARHTGPSKGYWQLAVRDEWVGFMLHGKKIYISSTRSISDAYDEDRILRLAMYWWDNLND